MDSFRIAKEFAPIFRDHGQDGLAEHPFCKGVVDSSVAAIWFNTVRLTSPSGSVGSGSLVHCGLLSGVKILTNAHVVDSHDRLTYEWLVGPVVFSGTGSVVAVDYVHDLAVLELENGKIPHPEQDALEIGEPPIPGEQVSLCGFPRGCDLPRLVRGVISGYEAKDLNGVLVTSVVVQAPVNQGNSGGPICNEDGQLVGITYAINPRVSPMFPRPRAKAAIDAINWLTDALVPVDGYGYALDPQDVSQMVTAISEAENLGRHELNRPPPERLFPQAAFVELQRQVVLTSNKPAGTSCIGIFNFSPARKVLLGWNQREQCALEAPSEWIELLSDIIPASGGHFYLRGHHVVRYYRNRKYRSGIWVCAAVLALH